MWDTKTVTIYKTNSDRSDFDNYRGFFLLNTVGKPLACISLVQLQKLAKHVYPESQCGFYTERSIAEMIFSVSYRRSAGSNRNPSIWLSLTSSKCLTWLAELACSKSYPRLAALQDYSKSTQHDCVIP